MSPIARRTGAALLVAVLTALLLPLAAAPASAASFRYWGYYTWTDGAWTFATTGPDETKPADGAVEGWRYAVTTESAPPRIPRADGDFDAICATTPAAAGKKRVAVVIDAGLPADAPSGSEPPGPRGDCAVVDEAASGAVVLAAVATARVENGLVCALDGYPAQGCADEVDIEPPATPDPQVSLSVPQPSAEESAGTAAAADEEGGSDDDGPPWLALGIGALLVAALAGAAAWRARSGSRS